MDRVVLLFCSLLSCGIIINIMFQFLDERCERIYQSRSLYRCTMAVSILLLTGVNCLDHFIFNFIAHLLVFVLVSLFLYYDERKGIARIAEAVVLYIVIAVLETLGVFLLLYLLEAMGQLPDSAAILQSMVTAFSKVILLFLYYIVFRRLWRKLPARSGTQYVLYLVLFVYSAVNVLTLAFISGSENPVILMLMTGCIVFANLYMLYFIKVSDERNDYKLQVDMMRQQERMQYENYEARSRQYTEMLRILHDVDKHMKMVDELYRQNHIEDAVSYAGQIRSRMKELVPLSYTNNTILNCLLSDKTRQAEQAGIRLEISASMVDINFMKPVDITTIFGNLMDNAMAAAYKCEQDRYVRLSVEPQYDMLLIRITNSTTEKIVIKNGRIPENKKGTGIRNIERCVSSYDGSETWQCADGVFACDIILNRIESQS